MNMTDTTADGDVRWDPDNEEFIEDVVLWGVASWTVGVAVLVAFLIYFMVRCICWICLNDVRLLPQPLSHSPPHPSR